MQEIKITKKDKETFYFRGSKLKDGFIRSYLLAKAPKSASTKKDVILFEIQNVSNILNFNCTFRLDCVCFIFFIK